MKKAHIPGICITLFVLLAMIMCGCSSIPDDTQDTETMPISPNPWGITLDQFYADLRVWDRDVALSYADGIMRGDLYVDSLITEPVPYAPQDFDWNREETESPATFQLYLQSLGMIKFLTLAALELDDPAYLSRAAFFIEDWNRYEQDEVRSAGNPKVWYDHGSALRAENLIFFILAAEEMGFADDPLRDLVRGLLIDHAEFLDNDDNYTHNHNHGIFQDEALLYIGAALPDHENAAQWMTHAKARLSEQLDYAFTEEFVHVENSSAYCVGVIELFSRISRLLQAIDDPYGETLGESIGAMVDFYTRLIMPNGYIVTTGDSFYGAASDDDETFGNPFLQYILSKGTEGMLPDARSAYYPKSGYFISQETYRKDHMREATWVMFKAGYVSATHKHADDLSILLCSKGYEIFIDPGMYNYMSGDPYRDYLISSRAHNTVNVDGQTYSVTAENSSKTGLLQYTRTDEYEYVLGFNNMYPGVEIDRHFYSANDAIVLYDDIRSKQQHTYSQTFTLSEDMQILSLTPRETVLKIADTDYLVRIRQFGNIPGITLLRSEKDQQGNLYGIASDSLNEVHDVNTLKYDLTGTNEAFITVITIEDADGNVRIAPVGEGNPSTVPADSVSYDAASNTVFLGQMPVMLKQRQTPDISSVQWNIQNDRLLVYIPENGSLAEYEWSLLRRDSGEILARTDWSIQSSTEFALPDCAFLVKVTSRDSYGQVKSWIVGAWSDKESGRSFSDADALNYAHLADTATLLEGKTYQFTAGLDYALDYSLRWYVYRNGSMYYVQTIQNDNTFRYTFEEPGWYTVSYYVRTQNGDYEYWVLPGFQID